MATDKISDLIDDKVFSDFDKLNEKLNENVNAFIQAINKAESFNQALGKSASFKDFTDNQVKASEAISQVEAAQEKARIAEIKLQVAREKAFDDYEKKLQKQQQAEEKAAAKAEALAQKKADAEEKVLNRYLVNESKREAARQSAMQKELADAERQVQKLNDIAAKRKSQIGPTITSSQGGDRELTNEEAEAIGRKARAEQDAKIATLASIQAENQKAQAAQATTESINIESAAVSNSDKVLNGVTGTLRQNISQLVQQRSELKEVQSQLKGSAAGNEALTKRELELKNAISANSLVIKQQIRDQQSATSSNDQLTARLNLLRKAYNSLSAEEQQNAQIGGVLLKNIEELSTKTTKANEAQGRFNDSVGNYENAIKRAISAYVPYGNQIVQGVESLKEATSATNNASSGLTKLGLGFASFTIAGFAVAMASASYYLSLFADTGNKVDVFLAGLKGRFASIGQDVVESVPDNNKTSSKVLGGFFNSTAIGAIVNLFKRQTQGAADAAESVQKLRIQYNSLNDVLTQNIQRSDAQAQKLRTEAKNRLLSNDERTALLKKADEAEQKSLDNAKKLTDARIDLAINEAKQYNKLSPEVEKRLRGGDIALANQLSLKGSKGGISKQAYEDLKDAYSQRTALIQQETLREQRILNDAARIEKKDQTQLTQDALFELQKKLEGEKLTAKLILDDDKQSYEARFAALKIYYARSKDLIDNERKIANAVPNISGARVRGNNQDAKNKLAQLNDEQLKAQQGLQDKINKEVQENYKRQLSELKGAERQKLEAIQNATNARLQESENSRLDEETALNNQYNSDKISYKQYQEELTKIANKYALERLQIALDGAKQMLITDSAQLVTGVGDPKKAEADASKVINLEKQVANEKSKIRGNEAKTDQEKREFEKQQLLDDFNNSLQLAQEFSDLYVQNIENRIKRQSDLLDQQTQLEKDQVANSVGTQTDKNRRLMAIDLQAAAQKKQLQEEENKARHKAAVIQKAANLANAAESIALSILKTGEDLGYPAAIPFQVIAGTIGAAQLALIAAQPIPAYEKGTESARGGLSIWGEKGRELGITPDGRMMMSPDKATMANIPKGTKIFTANETARILAKSQLNQPRSESSVLDNSEVVAALREVNSSVKSLNVKQRGRGIQQNGNWNLYLQRNGLN